MPGEAPRRTETGILHDESAVNTDRTTGTSPSTASRALVGIAAVLLVAAAIGVLARSPSDDAAPASLDVAVPSREPEPLAASEQAPHATELGAVGPVESLVSDTEASTGLSRTESQVLSTWGAPAPTGARAPCTLIVIDPLDRPVAGALVQVWGDDRPRESGHIGHHRVSTIGPFQSTTGPDGRCELRPPPYRPRVVVEKAGVGRSDSIELSPIDEHDQYKVVLVPLARLARLRGRVLHPDGAAAKGVTVKIDISNGDDDEPLSVNTDAEGRFEHDVPGVGRLMLQAVVPGEKTYSYWVRPTGGETCEALLWLRGEFSLRGRLLQADGTAGPEGVEVELWPDPPADDLGRDVWMHDRDAKTDATGQFAISLKHPVSGILTASGRGIGGLAETPHVVIDGRHPQLEMTLVACPPGAITGRVIDEAGGVLELVRLSASAEAPLDPSDRPRTDEFQGSAKTRSGKDGSFSLSPLHPSGRYTVVAQAQTGRILSVRHVSPGEDELVLVFGGAMEQDASLALVVSEAETGRRVDAFRAAFRQHEGDISGGRIWSQSYRGTSGIAVLDRQPKGLKYDALISAEGRACAFVADADATIEGRSVQVTLPLLLDFDVDIRVDGAAAAWAVVEAERLQSAAEDVFHARHGQRHCRSDERGRARLIDLEPGRYSLRVMHGEQLVRRELEVSAESVQPVVIDLR